MEAVSTRSITVGGTMLTGAGAGVMTVIVSVAG